MCRIHQTLGRPGDIAPTVACGQSRPVGVRGAGGDVFCYILAGHTPACCAFRSPYVSPKAHSGERSTGATSLARRRVAGQLVTSAREGLAAMGRRLYVGNLPYKCTDEDLTELFSRAGAVDNVRVMRDQATGRARGFAFVEMVSDDDAQKAINEFHQYQMDGRALVVNEARPKPAGGDFGGGGGGGRGGYGGGGGRREPRW